MLVTSIGCNRSKHRAYRVLPYQITISRRLQTPCPPSHQNQHDIPENSTDKNHHVHDSGHHTIAQGIPWVPVQVCQRRGIAGAVVAKKSEITAEISNQGLVLIVARQILPTWVVSHVTDVIRAFNASAVAFRQKRRPNVSYWTKTRTIFD